MREWRIGHWLMIDLVWDRHGILFRVFRPRKDHHYWVSDRLFGFRLEFEPFTKAERL